MRTSSLLAGTLAATILVWNFGARAYAADAKAEITALEHQCAAATSADELMAKCYDSSNEVAVYDLTPPLEFAGPKAVHDDFDNFFKNVKNPKIEFVKLHVYADGKMGFARSIQHFTGTSNDGKPMDMTFRVTDCLHKVNGKWKILHTHVSFPVDLATGKAEFQAKL
jgi:ketosteroid isomerase-like protein